MKKVRLLSPARNDLRIGSLFYERQSPGLGDYFYVSLFSDIDSLKLYGGIHPLKFGYYRSLSKRFPYAIYYTVPEEKIVLVYRILDCRMDPKTIRDELGR